ncbi:MAG TPA: hypothetical protein VNQ32_10910 [Steroidobacteraceae bacterium]|nr:hypothetical protein [Steroidobacteraceae bacterium]
MTKTLSSPNRLVWTFADAARSLAAEAEASDSLNVARQKAASATVMAVACVESFLNVQARLLLLQNSASPHKERLERDLRAKKSLGRKLEEWPLLLFGEAADFGQGPAQRFKATLDSRNALMHFISDTQSLEFEGFVANGLIDTSEFDNLTALSGWSALETAEDFIAYLLQLGGAPAESIPHLLHHWVAKVPRRAA